MDQIPPLFGGPARKSGEWTGLPGSGKRYKRSLGGEGEMMLGHEAVMYMMSRKDDLDGWEPSQLPCSLRTTRLNRCLNDRHSPLLAVGSVRVAHPDASLLFV